ncbi:hypothetical protein [Jiella pelagia]|uniref:Uncharacterized protein n=1 Tax=Jiella pelagia TaxID=2986949 RepID=A0ABY7C218_9HYPH|nr:hypothetical protein [Jiella pelagia]WAP69276.1 hypothetical protein OH818_02950 [Jiella pelagia]
MSQLVEPAHRPDGHLNRDVGLLLAGCNDTEGRDAVTDVEPQPLQQSWSDLVPVDVTLHERDVPTGGQIGTSAAPEPARQ